MFHLFSLVVIGIFSIQNVAAQKFITGKVTHTGAAKIDGNVQVEIELRDISLMDVASKLIASTKISNPKSFPIVYKLQYNPSDIKPRQTYAMSARITGPGDKLLYTNDVRITAPLTENQSPTIDIPVVQVKSPPESDASKGVPPKPCPSVSCPKIKSCPYGYQKKDGCLICKCNDPCNPSGKGKVCPAGQRCSVEKQADGTFAANCAAGSKKQKANKDQKDTQGNTKANCNLPKLVGSCRGMIPRFFYNPATKSCESFNYGGCQGNTNNFATKAACEAACKA